MGLGALSAKASVITDGMFLEAAKTLSQFSPSLKDPKESLFPPIEQVRSISRAIAISVVKKAIQEGVSSLHLEEVEKAVDGKIWEPHYPKYVKA